MERIPRVSRVEYLFAFLEGLNRKLSMEELAEVLGKCKLSFEEKKYKALGRGRPFISRTKFAESPAIKTVIAKSLVNECACLAKKLGLINAERNSLTDRGVHLIHFPEEKRLDKFAQLYVSAFKITKQILVKLNLEKNKEFLLPDYRHRKFKEFTNFISDHYGITVDVLSFIAIRDILWQLGYVNWYQYKMNGEPWFKVYLTSRLSEEKMPAYTLTFTFNSKIFYVKKNGTTMDNFLNALWTEYMERTNDVQYIPVLYSELRNSVCYRLRISDEIFDEFVRKILAEDKTTFRLIWSSGAVPYERDTLSLLKNLPALSQEGQYMTYLLIGRK
jgi:hypothetical protein